MLLALILFYDSIIDATIWTIQTSQEWIEYTLESIIEYFFHTNHHQSEIIVINLYAVFIIAGLYLLWKIWPLLARKLKSKADEIYMREKSNFLSQWRVSSLKKKILWIMMAGTAVSFSCLLI
jgi:hypothetical protein